MFLYLASNLISFSKKLRHRLNNLGSLQGVRKWGGGGGEDRGREQRVREGGRESGGEVMMDEADYQNAIHALYPLTLVAAVEGLCW